MIHVHPGDVALSRCPPGLSCRLVQECLPIRPRRVQEGATIYRAGEPLVDLHLIRCGVFKAIVITKDGREKVVSLRFAGDWLGFDGIAQSEYVCDACAMEPGEIWSVRYESVLKACASHPQLSVLVHRAMSEEMAQDRESMQSMSGFPADARVARFLLAWLETMSRLGLRTDRISLPMKRSEIGNYLGLTLESVSRAFSHMDRQGAIRFLDIFHRELEVCDVGALSRLAHARLETVDATLRAC